MVVRCSSCQATYRLDRTRVPESGLRVRCPGCGHIFRVREAAPTPALAAGRPGMGPAPAPAPAVSEAGARTPTTAAPAAVPAETAPASEPIAGLERSASPPRGVLRPQRPGRPAPATPAVPPRRQAWQAERTLDLDAAEAAARPAPQLETPPFHPGATPIPPVAAPAISAVAAPPAPARAAADAQAHDRARRLARVLVSDILVYNQEVRDRARRDGNLASALAGEVNKAWELYKSKADAAVLRSTSYFKDALNEILAEGQKIF